MKILLDTHVFLWWLENNPRLGKQARRHIANPANRVLLSAVSCWEISIKMIKGHLVFPFDISQVLSAEGFEFLPISLKETVRVASLPPVHRDPFDRLLAAQAEEYGCKLFTADKQLLKYPVALFDCSK